MAHAPHAFALLILPRANGITEALPSPTSSFIHEGEINCLHVSNCELSVMKRVAGGSRFFTCGHRSGSSTGCPSSPRTDVIHTLPSPGCDYQGILLLNNVPQGDPIMGTRTQVLFSSKETRNSKEVSGSEKEYGRE